MEEVGAGVTKLKKGDEVYGRLEFTRIGAYAQYAVANESEVAPKPKSIDHVHAAAVPLAALAAWQALFDIAKLEAGQSVLIHGAAGGVGHFAVQIARWKGAHVIATAERRGRELRKAHRRARGDRLQGDPVRGRHLQPRRRARHHRRRDAGALWQTLKEDGILVSTVGDSRRARPRRNIDVRGEAFTSHPDAEDLSEIARPYRRRQGETGGSGDLPLEQATMAHEMIQSGSSRRQDRAQDRGKPGTMLTYIARQGTCARAGRGVADLRTGRRGVVSLRLTYGLCAAPELGRAAVLELEWLVRLPRGPFLGDTCVAPLGSASGPVAPHFRHPGHSVPGRGRLDIWLIGTYAILRRLLLGLRATQARCLCQSRG